MYLEPSKGDVGLEIYTAADFYAALQYGLDNPEKFASIVIDNFNLFWDQLLEEKSEEKGREIKGQDWREIKGPLKAALRKIMRSGQNVVITCWTKDILYTKEEPTMPGVEGKTVILTQDNPQIEKTVPYSVDLLFRTDVVKDKMFRPTNIHTVTFIGGRRPVSVPPKDLFTGMSWRFDSKAPVNIWDTIIAPIEAKWLEGAVEHLDIDPGESVVAEREMKSAWEDQQVGSILASLRAAPDLDTLKRVWLDAEGNVNKDLPPNKRQIIIDEKERRKKELARG